MIIQTFKKHQFIFCTFFVLLGLITVYSPSYGGNYTGGPAGGHGCVKGGVKGAEGAVEDGVSSNETISINSQFRIDDEDNQTDGYHYMIDTSQDSIAIHVPFQTNVSFRDINGEWILLDEVNDEEIEEQSYFISGLQPDTEYAVRITNSDALCGRLVKTEPSPTIPIQPTVPIRPIQPQRILTIN